MGYLKGITHCTFLCKDYDKMVTFYRDVLGLRQIFRTPIRRPVLESMKKSLPQIDLQVGEEWMTYLEVAPHNFIELCRIPYQGENDTTACAFHHVCFQVEDIVAAARDLEEKGVQLWNGPSWKNNPYRAPFPVNPQPNPLGMITFVVNDPEGNQIEYMQYSADSNLAP